MPALPGEHSLHSRRTSRWFNTSSTDDATAGRESSTRRKACRRSPQPPAIAGAKTHGATIAGSAGILSGVLLILARKLAGRDAGAPRRTLLAQPPHEPLVQHQFHRRRHRRV